jgi:tRNA/tmRNA/rRNA uracil-C5-methylase (TrmA/RlmC/RlmD family)
LSKKAAKLVEAIVLKFNEKYQIEPYDRLKNEGFWRILLYRESKLTKEVMISVIVTKMEMPHLEEIKADLAAAFKVG